MMGFYYKKKGLFFLLNLLLWLGVCLFFIRFSLLRPICNVHIYKEFVCVGLIFVVVIFTRWFSIPRFFSKGRYGLFWTISACLLLVTSLLELWLVKTDILEKVYPHQNIHKYLIIIYLSILFRDSCFFAWFLVFDLYSFLKETFKMKQRASVMEHQAVQFSLSGNTDISIPLNRILYIQKSNHIAYVHCDNNEVFPIINSLSYCKEMIPSNFWTSDGPDKMLFHPHITEHSCYQQHAEIKEIKKVVILTNQQFQIYEIIRNNPGCKTTFIEENLSPKSSLRTVQRNISALRSKGVVAHIGSKKGGGYEICGDSVVLED